ncbi:hypothetical protein FB446DRAFT_846890 [Lentinula raphanica]|nr:hypothetical protein FB446DRAFT_846890 [Lentinula raphanica]
MRKLPESVPALDTLLDSLRNQKTYLLHQLEKIDSDIAAAERKRAKIWNEAAFVYKLPPELLSHIFLLCQKDEPTFPLIAARVCSPWRTSAVGTRMLWTDINITLEHPYDVQRSLDKMETYLTRSGPSSLFAVRLDVGDHLDFAPFLKLIASHISRCAHLSICVQKHTRACVPLIHECLDSLWAPHLGYLALHIEWVEGAHDRMMYGAPSILKAGAPSLNHLQLTGYASGLLPPISGGITTLHLDGEYMSTLTLLEYREILAANPRLVNLSLQWLEVESSTSTDLRAVELPMLRSLRIRTDESYHSFTTSTKALLSVLPLSSLESLVLYDTVDDLDSFEFPNVKDLALHYCTFPDDQIAIDHLMLAFPSVVRLTLQHKSILYKALSVHREPVMWPNLRTLCIRELDAMSFVEDVSVLSKLVQERSRMNSPLESVYFDNSSRRLAVDIIPALETLTKIGWTSVHQDPWPPGPDMDPAQYDNFWER